MLATREALRRVTDIGDNSLPPDAIPLIARMRQQMRQWVTQTVTRAWEEPGAEIRDRLVNPLRDAGLGPYERVRIDSEVPDDVNYGSLVRLDVTPAQFSAPHPFLVVVLGLRLNVSSDDAVYLFDENNDHRPRLALAWETQRIEYETDGRSDVTCRVLPRSEGLMLVARATHQRAWSRWQWMSWTQVSSAPGGGPARERTIYEDSIDVQGACGPLGAWGYGGDLWLDPDGLTTFSGAQSVTHLAAMA